VGHYEHHQKFYVYLWLVVCGFRPSDDFDVLAEFFFPMSLHKAKQLLSVKLHPLLTVHYMNDHGDYYRNVAVVINSCLTRGSSVTYTVEFLVPPESWHKCSFREESGGSVELRSPLSFDSGFCPVHQRLLSYFVAKRGSMSLKGDDYVVPNAMSIESLRGYANVARRKEKPVQSNMDPLSGDFEAIDISDFEPRANRHSRKSEDVPIVHPLQPVQPVRVKLRDVGVNTPPIEGMFKSKDHYGRTYASSDLTAGDYILASRQHRLSDYRRANSAHRTALKRPIQHNRQERDQYFIALVCAWNENSVKYHALIKPGYGLDWYFSEAEPDVQWSCCSIVGYGPYTVAEYTQLGKIIEQARRYQQDFRTGFGTGIGNNLSRPLYVKADRSDAQATRARFARFIDVPPPKFDD